MDNYVPAKDFCGCDPFWLIHLEKDRYRRAKTRPFPHLMKLVAHNGCQVRTLQRKVKSATQAYLWLHDLSLVALAQKVLTMRDKLIGFEMPSLKDIEAVLTGCLLDEWFTARTCYEAEIARLMSACKGVGKMSKENSTRLCEKDGNLVAILCRMSSECDYLDICFKDAMETATVSNLKEGSEIY